MASPNSAWIDLSEGAWATEVAGPDAASWLGDLITADVAGLSVGRGTRSLLLTPTGRIRADVWLVHADEDRFVLLQADDQPEPIRAALAPYVLSSEVILRPVDGVERILSLPAGAPHVAGARWTAGPSPADAEATLASFDPSDVDSVAGELSAAGIQRIAASDVEDLRIASGTARFPVDLTPASVPAEDDRALAAIDSTKGCFLGQESVAKIRNLGHPTHLIRSLRSPGPIAVGDEIEGPAGAAGSVTSVAPNPAGGFNVIARLAWTAAGGLGEPPQGFHSAGGSVLESRTPVR